MTLVVLLASKRTPSLDVSPGSELLSVLLPVEQGVVSEPEKHRTGSSKEGSETGDVSPSKHPLAGVGLVLLRHCCSLPGEDGTCVGTDALPASPLVPYGFTGAPVPGSRCSCSIHLSHGCPSPGQCSAGESRTMPSGAGQPLLQPPRSVQGVMALGTPPVSTSTIPTCPLGSPPRWHPSSTSFWGLRPTTESTSLLHIPHAR